jgi:hypothetical protein
MTFPRINLILICTRRRRECLHDNVYRATRLGMARPFTQCREMLVNDLYADV